jgi:hypothetical protein
MCVAMRELLVRPGQTFQGGLVERVELHLTPEAVRATLFFQVVA